MEDFGSDTDRRPESAEPTFGADEGLLDALFEALAHARRRRVLRTLDRHGTELALADLADEIAVRERNAVITEIPADVVKRLYMSLYHTHVPKLSEADLVRYDQERDAVASGANFRRVAPFLRTDALGDDRFV
ncbi:DUF7344 domain-containing protein [Halegenticoccus tardaugens]|uniref:DUF7344 domain-containing protein n=1 Tax=Halegenticoccus tardaugens TaxID=2071624 RepID=UPI00100A833D|nr:DNA-binding protein [Halegenticoccus tardaugens]